MTNLFLHRYHKKIEKYKFFRKIAIRISTKDQGNWSDRGEFFEHFVSKVSSYIVNILNQEGSKTLIGERGGLYSDNFLITRSLRYRYLNEALTTLL